MKVYIDLWMGNTEKNFLDAIVLSDIKCIGIQSL